MSPWQFINLLVTAAEIDATTKPEVRPELLRAGKAVTFLGGTLLVIAGLITRQLSCGVALAALLVAIGLLLLLAYGLAAKLYGQVALGFLCAVFSSCVALVVIVDSSMSNSGQAIAQDTSTAPQTVLPFAQPSSTPPSPSFNTIPASGPTTPLGEPTLAQNKTPSEPIFEQVYIDPVSRVFHTPSCNSRPSRTYRMPKSMALKQGFTAAADCHNHEPQP